MKWIKKNWAKVFSAVLIVIISVYVLSFGTKKARNYEVLKGKEKQQNIYTIWHVETFEGGGKPRIDYLKKIARDLENQDETILFMIKSIDARDLQNLLETANPDIMSFGYGVGKTILPYLVNFDKTFNVRDELISSGSFNKKLYAVPYIVSGYALFNHSMQSKEFHVGKTDYTSPEDIYNKLNLNPTELETQYEAYKNFVYDKNVQLLGTGRDLFRINNLNNIGRTNAMITPIDSYTDLIQYIGISNNNLNCKKFVEMALSDNYQNSLVDYSLFSSKYNKLYCSGIYNDMENAILNCEIPSVFK